jgi:DNA-binding NtrC family response regulator
MADSSGENWGIIGTSQKILDVLRIIRQVADTDVTILILGESGTGKEMVARAIHKASGRSNNPLVSVNCGAIPEGLLESELYGHEKGAFTGAVSRRAGYFEMAHNGTIFLDEIGEMSVQTQVKLLRVLELGEYFRVGGNQVQKTNARVITATNKDLHYEVQKGNFRQDLYYRLKTVTISLPPLRERREDLELIMNSVTEQLEKKYTIHFEGFEPEALNRFYHYDWPGNIRELKNVLESIILLNKGKRITVADLPENIGNADGGISGLPVPTHKSAEQSDRELIYRALLSLHSDIEELKTLVLDTLPLFRRQTSYVPHEQNIGDVSGIVDVNEELLDDISVKKIEADAIREALRRFNGNRRLAAKTLGISERTLYRRLKKIS